MNELSAFANAIKDIMEAKPKLDIAGAREIVRLMNDFLYTTYDGIGTIRALDREFEYFSDFHKFWHKNYADILDCRINDEACEKVAIALHDIYLLTGGEAFREVWAKNGLADEDVCRVRLFTANQDFRGSLNFKSVSNIFKSDPSAFDEVVIDEYPEHFIATLGLNQKSQSDKRSKYAQKIASFVIDRGCAPIDLIKSFGNDVSRLREALIECNAGYGYKKADMFIRDMIVLGIWENVSGFDSIDVASDVNTMKVALRTGIITTAIPLVTSFLDIFCYQYGNIEGMNAKAWRRVWEKWTALFPNEALESPCLLDYFVYRVVGKQFCGNKLAIFQCDEEGHQFRWHSSQNRTCQVCYRNGKRHVRAQVIAKVCPCADAEGDVAIMHSEFVKNLPAGKTLKECPFSQICAGHRHLQPPKSISIMGQTGWETARAHTGDGGGGLMA